MRSRAFELKSGSELVGHPAEIEVAATDGFSRDGPGVGPADDGRPAPEVVGQNRDGPHRVRVEPP